MSELKLQPYTSSLDPELFYAGGLITEITQNGLVTIELSESVQTYLNYTKIGVNKLDITLF